MTLVIPLHFLTALAKPATAANVRNLSSGQEGNRVFVQYDLVGKIGEREVDVEVVLRIGGETYHARSLSLEGDFGKNVVPGPGKRFYWHVLKDLPGGFEGELTWEVTARTFVPPVAPSDARTSDSAQDNGKVPAPTFRPGDTWVFAAGSDGGRTFEETYVGEEKDLLAFAVKADGRQFKRYQTRETNFVRDEGGIRYAKPHSGLLEFPLHLAKKWGTIYEIETISGPPALAQQGMVDSSAALRGLRKNGYTVTAWEKVRTPAGEFEAFRIEGSDALYGATFSVSVSVKMWYAPSAKRIVKSRGKSDKGGFDIEFLTYELVSFKLQ